MSTPVGFVRPASHEPSGATSSAACPARVAIVLAGRGATTRTVALSSALGLPVAALPINAERNLVECWIKRMVAGGFRGKVVLAINGEAERAFYASIAVPDGIEFTVRVDSSGHRGAGGTTGDAWTALVEQGLGESAAGGAIVVESSNLPLFDFARFFGEIDQRDGALVGATARAEPAGIMWLSSDALLAIPRIGYFDLKEQLVTALVAGGRRVRACSGSDEACRINDLKSYLRAVGLMHASGAEFRCGDTAVAPGAVVRGASLLCRGATVERGALVVDSIVLPGARVCADAVVARSIVPPGTHVPCGYLVVDEIFGALGSPARSGTEGGAS
jgi:hypothetical protein